MLGWAWLGSWCALPSGTLLLAPLQILQYECVLYTWVYKGLPYAIIIDLDWNLNYRPWKWNATLYTYIWFVFINFFKQQNWKNNSVIPFERFFFHLVNSEFRENLYTWRKAGNFPAETNRKHDIHNVQWFNNSDTVYL